MANNLINTKQLIDDLNNAWAKHTQYLDIASSAYLKLVNSAKLPSSYVEAVKTQAENNKKLEKSVKDLEKAELKAQRARIADLKLQKKREVAFDKYERQLQREERQLNRTQGLYNRIQRGVNSVTRSYNDLAAKKALNGKLTQKEEIQLDKLSSKLNKYQEVLKKVDGNIGKYQRNVGNYGSSWNGLSNSINQLTREAPAFANSVQTGFMALSNNIPILTDEIGRLIAANKALQAEGKPTVSVFRQIMKSLFSFQTLMSVGITLLVLYGKEIGEWSNKLFSASKSTDSLLEGMSKLDEQVVSQTGKLRGLIAVVNDKTKSDEDRLKALKLINKEYPELQTNLTLEKENLDKLNNSIVNYIKLAVQRVRAIELEKEIGDIIIENIKLEQQLTELTINENDMRVKSYRKLKQELEDAYSEKNFTRVAELQNDIARSFAQLSPKQQEYIKLQQEIGLNNQEVNKIVERYLKNIDLSSESLDNNTKSIKSNSDAELESNKIKGKAIGLIDSLIFGYDSYARAKERAEKDTTNIFEDGTFIQPEVLDNTEEQYQVTFDNITDITRRAFGIMTSLSDAYFNRQFSNLEREKETALKFADDSATARAEIERQYEEKRRRIQQRQAQAKKNQALFDITVDTASAVVRALPNIPLSVAVGVLGAAQLALVASQQIPQFWQGGEVGGMQDIIVNDDPFGVKGRNYKEVIEKPNGQILTPQGKNVKMRVPKGSYVHPTYDAFINSLDHELINNNIMPIGQSNIMPMVINNGLTKDDIYEVMSAHGKGVVKAINNKESFRFDINERGINKYVVKNGETRKIMNSRYSGKGKSV